MTSKGRFLRVKVGGDLLPLLVVNLVHLGWKLMAKSNERVWIGLTNFISKSSHHSFDVLWSWVAIDSLRINCPFSLDVPEVVPLGTKKELMITLISPQRRRMTKPGLDFFVLFFGASIVST